VKKTLGLILIGLGVIALIWGGFTYTTSEKLIDIGPIHASTDERHTIPLPPIAGAILLIGGIALLATGPGNNRATGREEEEKRRLSCY
jgi:hypothetical protein